MSGPIDHPSIARRIVENFDAARQARRYRSMSVREVERLTKTTEWLLREASAFAGTMSEALHLQITDEVQAYCREEWYGLRTQIEYLQMLRAESSKHLSGVDGDRLHAFIDTVTLIAIEACRRPDRYEWPTLVLVGFGNLASTKLVEPIRALVAHNPVDAIVVDRDEAALKAARKTFRGSGVSVVSASNISQEIAKSRNPKVVYVATDSKTHFKVLNEYLGYDTIRVIAIEKPLTTDRDELELFKQLAREHRKVKIVVVDHYIFRRSALMVERAKRNYPELYNLIANSPLHLEFEMQEKQPVDPKRGASAEGVILDMLPHLFPFISMLITSDISQLQIDSVETWKYDDSKSPAETAAKVQLRIGPTQISARIGKGLAANRKSVSLTGTNGQLFLDLTSGLVSARKGEVEFTIGETPTKDVGYGYVLHVLLAAAPLEFQSLGTAALIAEKLLDIRDAARQSQLQAYKRGISPFF
jgi:predicted dehydrogenase